MTATNGSTEVEAFVFTKKSFDQLMKQLGAMDATLTALQERQDNCPEIEKKITELNRAVALHTQAVERDVKTMTAAVSETAQHARDLVDQISKVTNIRAELDEESLATFERRAGEIFAAAIPSMCSAIGEGVLRTVQPKLVHNAQVTFEGALNELKDAKPKGQGFTLAMATATFGLVVGLVYFHYQAFVNATPDKFKVEGAPGTTVRGPDGRVFEIVEAKS